MGSQHDFQSAIREAGLRATASRIAVLDTLHASDKPLSHAEVATLLEKHPWDRATLYRNLVDMTAAGLLRKIASETVWHFEAINESEHHPHFVCTECGSVECAPHVELRARATKKAPKAMRAGQYEIQVRGLCDSCFG